MITRLAPTPSGFLHTGNIFNFLLNWHWARTNGGKVFLRIDDADAERKRPEYVDDIFRVLEWLGLDWDIGPAGPDDLEKNWSQSCRKDMYDELLNELAAKDLLFACECSRKELADGKCDCRKKQLKLSTAGLAWRIQTAGIVSFKDKALGNIIHDLSASGSFIVRRKDGIAAYQLASLADDRHFAVTHIGRGEDLIASTAMQLYLDKQPGIPYLNNCRFWHHPLLRDDNGNKLSKSAGDQGRSIMHSMKKEELTASFEKWTGLDKKEMGELFTL